MKPDLAEIDIGARPYVVYVVADVLVGYIGLYRYPPMARVDGTKNIFPIYIHHFDGILSLDGPDPVGAVGREGSEMEGRSL